MAAPDRAAEGEDAGSPADAWLAGLRADDAAASRTRTAWLAQQASEEATVAGTLLDLAERGQRVQLTLVSGAGGDPGVDGVVEAVGSDVAVVWRAGRGTALVPLAQVATIRSGPGAEGVWGDRPPRSAATLRDLLAGWVAERPEVVATTGGGSVSGALTGVGLDVVVLRSGAGREPQYVALAAISLVTSRERLVLP